MGDFSNRERKLADYIYDDLAPEEMIDIEREIAEDPIYSDHFRLNMEVKNYLKAKIQLEEMRDDPQLSIAEELAEREADLYAGSPVQSVETGKRSSKKIRRLMAYVSAVAASITLLIVAGLFPLHSSSEKIFEQYYIAYAGTDFVQRNAPSELYQDMREGIGTYLAGDYTQALAIFGNIGNDPNLIDEVQLYKGLSYMGLGSYEQAQEVLEVAYTNPSRYHAETIWYLSLCYVKSGDIQQASNMLKELQTYGGLYKEDAQSLEKKLRRIRK